MQDILSRQNQVSPTSPNCHDNMHTFRQEYYADKISTKRN